MTVDVFGTEQLVSSGADVIDLQHPLSGKLALQAQEVVVNVRIANPLRQNNSGQDRDVRVEGSPTRQIAGGLRAYALSGVGGRGPLKWGSRCVVKSLYNGRRADGGRR